MIASCGGMPKDICLYQAQKGLDAASRCAGENGKILLVAECSQGVGDARYATYVRRFADHAAVVRDFERGPFLMGAHKAYLFSRAAVPARACPAHRPVGRNPCPLPAAQGRSPGHACRLAQGYAPGASCRADPCQRDVFYGARQSISKARFQDHSWIRAVAGSCAARKRGTGNGLGHCRAHKGNLVTKAVPSAVERTFRREISGKSPAARRPGS